MPVLCYCYRGHIILASSVVRCQALSSSSIIIKPYKYNPCFPQIRPSKIQPIFSHISPADAAHLFHVKATTYSRTGWSATIQPELLSGRHGSRTSKTLRS